MADEKTLYVCRPLVNGDDLHDWASSQGFKSALPKNELHVTVAFSREPIDWTPIKRNGGRLRVIGGKRSIEKLGDAIVLRFGSTRLSNRWREIRDEGASWDYPGYKPHVTISYDGAPSLKGIEPYRGSLVFGPEQFAEIDEDGNNGIKETPMADTTVQSNNKAVAFRGRSEREMPEPPGMDVSTTKPKKIGKPKTGKVRKRAKKLFGRGMISDKAMAKHMGE